MNRRHKRTVTGLGLAVLAGLQANSDARSQDLASLGDPRLTLTATATVNTAANTGRLLVNWGTTGSTTVFSGLTPTSTSLRLSLAHVGNEHVVVIGSQHIDLTTLANAPSIVADSTVTDNFMIACRGMPRIDRFSTFANFIGQLSTYINGAMSVITVVAVGTYDRSTNTLTASRILVLLRS